MIAAVHPDPTVLPGELDEILAELAARSTTPTRHTIISAALARRHPADFAAVLADAAERREQDDGRLAVREGAP